ncbi:divalent metal cation transporter, partial [Mycobacterium sp. 1245805.9]|uniref:divalent metal cation transporter n=1 Tax=Mycobacterium sp. 1245805.9 TaxID=1856862 RepID=UPI000B03275C
MTETTTPVADASDQPPESVSRRGRWLRWGLLAVWGPGLVVMLADTDAGSLITASQSGAQWGYRMVLPQLILMPILYVVQEMTVRLGIVTKKGHGALIRERFGRSWAWVSAFTLFASSIGMLTQRETPNSSPTPATPANSVSSAPIDDANSVNAETHAQERPNRSRISA